MPGWVVKWQQNANPVVCLAPAQGMFTGEQGRVHGKVSDKRLSHHRACDWGLVLSANLESKHSKWQRIQSSRKKIDWWFVQWSHPGGFLSTEQCEGTRD